MTTRPPLRSRYFLFNLLQVDLGEVTINYKQKKGNKIVLDKLPTLGENINSLCNYFLYVMSKDQGKCS